LPVVIPGYKILKFPTPLEAASTEKLLGFFHRERYAYKKEKKNREKKR